MTKSESRNPRLEKKKKTEMRNQQTKENKTVKVIAREGRARVWGTVQQEWERVGGAWE